MYCSANHFYSILEKMITAPSMDYFLVALPLMLAIMYQTVLEVYASVKRRVAVLKAIGEGSA